MQGNLLDKRRRHADLFFFLVFFFHTNGWFSQSVSNMGNCRWWRNTYPATLIQQRLHGSSGNLVQGNVSEEYGTIRSWHARTGLNSQWGNTYWRYDPAARNIVSGIRRRLQIASWCGRKTGTGNFIGTKIDGTTRGK